MFHLPSAILFAVQESSAVATATLSLTSVQFLLFVVCGAFAFWLARHYLRQNKGYYESIWRRKK